MLLLVVLVGLALTAAITLALVPVLRDLSDRQQARSAADAAALAGVTGGRSASASMAGHNDAVLVAWTRSGREVTVRVRVGDQVVAARATDGP
jgi:DNA-binding IclR family transcriptional regulator